MIADFTALTPAEVRVELSAVADDARAAFGALNAEQFNWRVNDATWSVAQCFEHLVKMNRLMCVGMTDAIDGTGQRSLVQRLPFLPGIFGRLLVKSQSPVSTRKFTAPRPGQPSASAIDRQMLDEFVEYNIGMAARLQAMGDGDLSRVIMVSPFASFIAYGLMDAWRLIAAHNRRHFEQAERVTKSAGFPA